VTAGDVTSAVADSTTPRVSIDGRRAVKAKPIVITAAMVTAIVTTLRDSSDFPRRLLDFAGELFDSISV
jgi:hypothetical protein